jgi:hypothetical protein
MSWIRMQAEGRKGKTKIFIEYGKPAMAVIVWDGIGVDISTGIRSKKYLLFTILVQIIEFEVGNVGIAKR